MRKTICILALVSMAGLADASVMYTVRESDDVLVQIDISNINAPVLTPVGALGTAFAFGGLTYDAGSGTLYMVAGRGNNALYTVNMSTGAATMVGSHGINDLFSVAWDSTTDTLYAAQFSGGSGLYTLNQGTGAATTINAAMTYGIGGMTYDPTRDMLVGSNDGGGNLYNIDRSNGNQTLIYDGPFVNDSGLAYDADNDLYWGIDWSGYLFYYDPSNGYARTDVLTGLGSYDGLAFIPTPGTLAVLGLGGLALRRRR